MKRVAAFALTMILALASAMPVFAQKNENRSIGENQIEAKRASKQYKKYSNKQAKRRQKAMKKYEKAQKKAAKRQRRRH